MLYHLHGYKQGEFVFLVDEVPIVQTDYEDKWLSKGSVRPLCGNECAYMPEGYLRLITQMSYQAKCMGMEIQR